MEMLTVNLHGKVRKESHEGRDYLVAPLTMIVEGVLNGSKGPLFYPAAEIGRNPAIWNGVPILVNHPAKGSGRSPDVYRKQKIGEVFNTVFQDGKLVAEGWFEVKATKRIDNRIYEALLANKQLELSTGLYGDYENAESGANYKGKTYTHVIRNFGADHLAILPDQIGACSLNDGCGVLVNEDGTENSSGCGAGEEGNPGFQSGNTCGGDSEGDPHSESESNKPVGWAVTIKDKSGKERIIGIKAVDGKQARDIAKSKGHVVLDSSEWHEVREDEFEETQNRGSMLRKLAEFLGLIKNEEKLTPERALEIMETENAGAEHHDEDCDCEECVGFDDDVDNAGGCGAGEEGSPGFQQGNTCGSSDKEHQAKYNKLRDEGSTHQEVMDTIGYGHKEGDVVKINKHYFGGGQRARIVEGGTSSGDTLAVVREDKKEAYYHASVLIPPKHRGQKALKAGYKAHKSRKTQNQDDDQSGSSILNSEESDMAFDRKATIQELVTNCDCWKKKEDQDVLNKMSDEGIEHLAKNEKQRRELITNAKKIDNECDPEMEDEDEEMTKKKKPFPPAQNASTSRLTDEEQEDLKFARNERNKQKKILIQKLVNNIEKEEDRVDYVKELATYNIDRLQMLVNLIPQRREPVRNSGGRDESEEFVQTFFGDTGPVVNRFGKEEARANAVPMPEWDWKEISNSRHKKS